MYQSNRLLYRQTPISNFHYFSAKKNYGKFNANSTSRSEPSGITRPNHELQSRQIPRLDPSDSRQDSRQPNWHLFQVAFPNDQHPPSQSSQCRLIGLIADNVACQLFKPEFSTCARRCRIPAAVMTMPKAPVNKDSSAVFP